VHRTADQTVADPTCHPLAADLLRIHQRLMQHFAPAGIFNAHRLYPELCGPTMQTQLAEWARDTDLGREADEILRRCVHCGFCLATCPTYQILGDELDSPRGRIYQIKQVLEGAEPTYVTQQHLDRCLTCR